MNRLYRNFIVLCFGCSLSACSLGPVKVDSIKTYTLSDSATLKATNSGVHLESITVMPVIATRGFDSTSMLYQTTPYQLAAFAENAWVAPPANMITPLLLKSLQQSGLFQAVILGPSVNNTTYLLNTTLLALYQDFTVNPSEIVLNLVVNYSSNQNNQVVADQVINIRVKTTANTPYAGVVAANQAIMQALNDVVQFVSHS